MADFGITAGGWGVNDYNHPNLAIYVKEIALSLTNMCNPANQPPPPSVRGIDLSPLLTDHPAEAFHTTNHFFGYLGSITDAPSTDTDSPFMVAVVVMMPFKYGSSSDGAYRSRAFGRVNAFASKCDKPRPENQRPADDLPPKYSYC